MSQPSKTTEPPSTRDLLSSNVVFERARAGLSQAGLANAAGVSRQNISDIERGAVNPSLDIIDKLATGLGVPVDRLFVYRGHTVADEDEIVRLRASGKDDTVNALEYLDALEESAGRPRRFSNAGRPRLGS